MNPPVVTRGRFLAITVLFIMLFLGCNLMSPGASSTIAVAPSVQPTGVVATQNPLFASTPTPEEAVEPLYNAKTTITATFTPSATPSVSQTPTPIPTQIPTATMLPPIVIFDDELNSDWELTYSDMPFDAAYTENSFTGSVALQGQPTNNRQVLLLTVRENADREYRREDFLGVTLQLFADGNFIGIDDMAMAVIGSNKFPYWVPNDETVINLDPAWEPDDESITGVYDYAFSPTRLHFLGVTNDIPPDNWVWITNWLDDRIADIEYEYITGIYIKNEDGFFNSFAIDDIQLILLPPGE